MLTSQNSIIPQIVEFGFVAWDFLIAIYKSGQDKLAASKNKTFRQSVSSQFNKVYINNVNTNKLSFRKIIKEKKVFIPRISSLISSRPSRSILAKLKFYKQNLLQNSKSKPQSKSYA